jgi:hypothetical protein
MLYVGKSFLLFQEVAIMIEINYLREKERIVITKFLQWNDRNGSYTDENCDMEEIPRMIYEDAVKYFFGVINDDYYYKIVDNIFELTYQEAIKIAKEKGFYDVTIEKLNSLVNDDNPAEGLYRSLI